MISKDAQSRRRRRLRGLSAAFFSVLCGLIVHTGAGGPSSGIAAALAFLGAAWLALVLSSLRLRTPAVIAVVVAGQWLLHFFVTITASAFGTTHHGTGSLLETSAHAACMGLVPTGFTPAAGSAPADGSAALMIAAHALAAVLSVLFVLFGETAVDAVLTGLLGPLVVAFLQFVSGSTPRRAKLSAARIVSWRPALERTAISLRGPPQLV